MERRGLYIEQLERKLPDGGQHPLVQLVKQCLRNIPSQRPTSEELIASLKEMRAIVEGPYGDVARADAVRQVVTMKALSRRDAGMREETAKTAAKDEEIHQLQQELELAQVQMIINVQTWWLHMFVAPPG